MRLVQALSDAKTATPQDQQRVPRAPSAAKLFSARKHVFHTQIRSVMSMHRCLADLKYAISLFLHLGGGGGATENIDMDDRRVPCLSNESIELRHGVNVSNFTGCECGAERGGRYLYPLMKPVRLADGATGLEMSGERPVFIAVEISKGQIWYGQLLLCFVGQYLSKIELCYVR